MPAKVDISDTLAESGIIATLIYNPLFIMHSESLKKNHFYNKELACLYWGINQLVKQGVENIDSINLTTVINSNEGIKNTFDKFGINLDNYIDLSKQIVRNSVDEYKILVNRVLSLSFKRELHKQLKKFDESCLNIDDDNINVLSTEIYDTVNKLNEQYVLDDSIHLIGDEIDSIWEEICNRRGEEGIYGIKPKIESLSNYFTYEKGEMVLIQARMKQGKSALLMNEAIHQLKQGHSVAYLDSEMSTRQMIERMLANLTQIDCRKIKTGNYTVSEEAMLKDALKWIKAQKFIHKYNPAWTNDMIFSTAKILQYKMGMDLLIFDYLKSNKGNASEVYNELGDKADFLKNIIAGGLNIPVLSAAQSNRAGEMADSDKLDRYTSVTVRWNKKDKDHMKQDWKKSGNYMVNVKYNRLGELMDEDQWIDVVFDGNKMNIYEAPEQHKEDEYGI